MAGEVDEAKVMFGWNQRREAGIGAERLAVGSTKIKRYSWVVFAVGRVRVGWRWTAAWRWVSL